MNLSKPSPTLRTKSPISKQFMLNDSPKVARKSTKTRLLRSLGHQNEFTHVSIETSSRIKLKLYIQTIEHPVAGSLIEK